MESVAEILVTESTRAYSGALYIERGSGTTGTSRGVKQLNPGRGSAFDGTCTLGGITVHGNSILQ